MLYQVEFKKDQELMYVHVNYPDGKLQSYLDSPAFENVRTQMGIHRFKLTGNVYQTQSTDSKLFQETKNYLVKGSVLIENRILTEEVDILVEQLERIEKLQKQVEKKLIELLDTQPEPILFGKVYGAMNCHTASTTPSYKKLFDKAKELVKDIPAIFNQLKDSEKQEKEPHKSSAPSLSTFAISKAEEKRKKIWKD